MDQLQAGLVDNTARRRVKPGHADVHHRHRQRRKTAQRLDAGQKPSLIRAG